MSAHLTKDEVLILVGKYTHQESAFMQLQGLAAWFPQLTQHGDLYLIHRFIRLA